MEKYIGAKIIRAELMGRKAFENKFKDGEHDLSKGDDEGYHVEYPGEYHSWSPRDVFEEAYREISEGEMDLLMNPYAV